MKSKTFILYLVLAAGLLFSFVHCKKDKVDTTCSDSPGSCQSVLEAKDYFAFNEGSWWVYEEENSGDRDSVYVTQASIDPDSYNFDVRMYSTYQDYYYHYWPEYISSNGCDVSLPVKKVCLQVKQSKYQLGNYIGERRCFFIQNSKGTYVNSFNVSLSDNKLTVLDRLNSYSIGPHIFGETIILMENSNILEGSQQTTEFISKQTGVVRKELLDSNKVWNLVSYHIE